MLQKIKNKLLILSSAILFALPLAAPAAVLAQCTAGTGGPSDCIQGGTCHGAQSFDVSATTEACTEQSTNSLGDLIKKVINILSVIVGVVAVIMIIIGGLRYITSGGESARVTSAKNTILYAIIGLVIVALAQIIVRFVLTRTTTSA